MSIETATAGVYRPFIESDPKADPAELQATMAETGYLFMRGVASSESILDVRRSILELCRDAGWLDPKSELMDAVVAPEMEALAEGQPAYTEVYRKVLQIPSFKSFPLQESLVSVGRKLVGDDVMVHPRNIGRLTFPSHTYAPTPPHQDFFYIRGSESTYTCWVPLGDCPTELGGLAVWSGSQHRGFLNHDAVNLKAVVGTGIDVNENEAEWHTGEFALGDALFFHSLTVHKAMPNQTADRLRISTDNRYQSQALDIDPSSFKPHLPVRAE